MPSAATTVGTSYSSPTACAASKRWTAVSWTIRRRTHAVSRFAPVHVQTSCSVPASTSAENSSLWVSANQSTISGPSGRSIWRIVRSCAAFGDAVGDDSSPEVPDLALVVGEVGQCPARTGRDRRRRVAVPDEIDEAHTIGAERLERVVGEVAAGLPCAEGTRVGLLGARASSQRLPCEIDERSRIHPPRPSRSGPHGRCDAEGAHASSRGRPVQGDDETRDDHGDRES